MVAIFSGSEFQYFIAVGKNEYLQVFAEYSGSTVKEDG